MKIGVLGAGQLGRMIALAGFPHGHTFRFFDTVTDAPASHLSHSTVAAYTDRNALLQFANGLDRITYEFENVPVEAAEYLNNLVPVFPPSKALEFSQDRIVEKEFFNSLAVPTPKFVAVSSLDELNAAVALIGFPCILKTRRLGYDGKGQSVLRAISDCENAWHAVSGAPSIVERMIPFEYEVSLIAVRGATGEQVYYPLVKNQHTGGILRISESPIDQNHLQELAEQYARRVLDELSYVGVLALEFFVVDGELLINEMAPRVHNSGHLTIEGSQTSQFENHLRAITGAPLGSTAPRGFSAMINLIGEIPNASDVLAMNNAHLHLYSKTPRPGRKLGHITIVHPKPEVVREGILAVMKILPVG